MRSTEPRALLKSPKAAERVSRSVAWSKWNPEPIHELRRHRAIQCSRMVAAQFLGAAMAVAIHNVFVGASVAPEVEPKPNV